MSRERPPTFSFDPVRDSLNNVRDFRPQPVKSSTAIDETKRVAEEMGFSVRDADATLPIDARSLRKSNRTAQLNISVAPATKNRFWRYAQEHGYSTGEDALLALLDVAQEARKR